MPSLLIIDPLILPKKVYQTLSMHLNFIIAQLSTNGKAVFFFKANVRTVEKRIFFAESNEELKEYLSYDNMI